MQRDMSLHKTRVFIWSWVFEPLYTAINKNKQTM